MSYKIYKNNQWIECAGQTQYTPGTNITLTPTSSGVEISASDVVTTDTTQNVSGNKNFTGTLQSGGVNVATTTDLATKQDTLPTVVNDYFLHANATTGALEWAAVASPSNVVTIADNQTITGTKTFTNSIVMTGGSIKQSTDSSLLALHGGSTTSSGASLYLYPHQSGSSTSDQFRLTSDNVTTNASLIGKADGTLTWAGNNVLTTSNGYTQTQVNNLLANKADTSALADYLPLAGGTLTGSLNVEGNDLGLTLKADSSHRTDIAFYDTTNSIVTADLRVPNGGSLQLGRKASGGSAWYNGGQVVIDTTGTVRVIATDSNGANSKTLQATNTNLTWGGTPIPVIKSKSIDGTTTSTGALNLNLGTNQIPLYLVLGYTAYGYYFRTGQGYAVLFTHDTTDGTIPPVANTAVTGTLYYLEFVS